jgi:holo-[acyl-carrier protein] synthase
MACERCKARRGRLDGVIMGIGVDVAEISRLQVALDRSPGLMDRLFTDSEQTLPPGSLAGCFAAKEAVAKALGAPPGLRWTDVIVGRDPGGRPVLETRGTVAAAAARLGITRWHVSISHDAGICVAMVVAEGDPGQASSRDQAGTTEGELASRK